MMQKETIATATSQDPSKKDIKKACNGCELFSQRIVRGMCGNMTLINVWTPNDTYYFLVESETRHNVLAHSVQKIVDEVFNEEKLDESWNITEVERRLEDELNCKVIDFDVITVEPVEEE